MTKNTKNNAQVKKSNGKPYQVRLPGFIGDEDIGLGDVIKRTGSYLGIQPCEGCNRRADALNRWLIFTNRK